MAAVPHDRWDADDARLPRLAHDWLGPRVWNWSGPLPIGRRFVIASSRLPRLIDPHGVWVQGLRAALERIRDQNGVIVVGRGTAGSELMLRGAARENLPVIRLHGCESERHFAASPGSKPNSDFGNLTSNLTVDGWVAPPHSAERSVTDAELQTVPERDRAAIAWADEVLVLALRAGGNLHRLLRRRLEFLTQHASVSLVDLAGLQSRKAREQLIALGAKLWKPTESKSAISNFKSQMSNQRSAIANPQFLIPCPPADGWRFLTHTTRACVGAWPGQSREDYLDSLLDARPDTEHSPLGVLMRIVAQRRLIASDRTIRRGYAVVSFTAVPLPEIPRLHVFRSHRGRWDFEPYGICIRRKWLESRGAKPVIYTGNSDWSRLGDVEQPFFQYVRHLDSTKAQPNRRAAGIDWSLEREWRHVGDLDLSHLAASDAVLFLPTAEESRKLLEISPWPVTVLP